LKKTHKNLILVRAGDDSLHPEWIDSGALDFEIFVSYYGHTEGKFKDKAHYYEAERGLKFPVLAKLLSERRGFFRDFDAIWFPDDDLKANPSTINRMFDLFHEYDLWLAQPALGPGSHVTFSDTYQVVHSKLRYSGFVEIMCPIIGKKALDILAPSFSLSASGWGLDFLWPHLLNYPTDRIAILDETPVIHTRPLGTGKYYDLCRSMNVDPHNNLSDILKQHNIQVQQIPIYSKIPLKFNDAAKTGCSASEISNRANDVGEAEQLRSFEAFPEEDALGPVQRDEASFLFGVVRLLRPKVVVEFGFGQGNSSLSFIKALNGSGVLYSYDTSENAAWHALHEFSKYGNFHFLKGSQEAFSADDIGGQFVDFAFFDGALDLSACQTTFGKLLPSLASNAIIAVHNTGLWARRNFLAAHEGIANGRSEDWLDGDSFQHRKDMRQFVNWIEKTFPEFQVIHLHSDNCIRHGISILQRQRVLKTASDMDNSPQVDFDSR